VTSVLRAFAPLHPDNRGMLGVLEFSTLPFVSQRLFWVSATSPAVVRADHAHLRCSQFLVCASGHVRFESTSPTKATYSAILEVGDAYLLKPRTWLKLDGFSSDALLLVFCDLPYDPTEYISDFNSFLALD
jgi:UDP-2-acetamido-3-amino-2,3-dideoxy-glucuronate N-acetyltransferase